MENDNANHAGLGKHKQNPVVIGLYLIAGTFLVTLTYGLTSSLLTPKVKLENQMTSQQNTFDVNASGKVSMVPTKASLQIGLETENENMELAKTELDEKVAGMKTVLTQIGIKTEEIQTQNYNVYPLYNYQDDSFDEVIGYEARTTLEIKSDKIELLNQAIDVAVANGANNVSNVEFELSDEDVEAAEMEATKIAYSKAVVKAEEIAQMVGFNLEKVSSFYTYCEESGEEMGMELDMAKSEAMADLAGSDMGTNLEAGSKELSCSITVTYTLK